MEGMIDEPRMMVVIVDPPVHIQKHAENRLLKSSRSISKREIHGFSTLRYFIQVRLKPSFLLLKQSPGGPNDQTP